MNLAQMRIATTEVGRDLDRQIQRLLQMEPLEISNIPQAALDDVYATWEKFGDMKRTIAAVRSSCLVPALGMTFTEIDMHCRDISDQIEFLDQMMDRLVVLGKNTVSNKGTDEERWTEEPHRLIPQVKRRIEDLSQVRAKLRCAAESFEHSVTVSWYEDEEVDSLMQMTIEKKEGSPKASSVPDIYSTPREEKPLPQPQRPPQMVPPPQVVAQPIPPPVLKPFADPQCRICHARNRAAIENEFVRTRCNIMSTLDRGIQEHWLSESISPNELRLHFDNHVAGISAIEGR